MCWKSFSFKLLVGFFALGLASRAEALAGDGIIDEIKLGFLSADTGVGGTKIEHGLDINGEILLAPRPDIGFTANTAGGTSFGYIGLNWTADLAKNILDDHDGVYFSFGFGGAISNSDLSGDNSSDNNKDMGSRALFHLYAELGYDVTRNVNVSVFYEHYSNAGLGTVNPGMNNLGMRLGYKF
jgi:lipid A 3-O-deacylase